MSDWQMFFVCPDVLCYPYSSLRTSRTSHSEYMITYQYQYYTDDTELNRQIVTLNKYQHY